MGTGVHIYCATHSIHVDERVAGYERAYPVELGDDMWIGGGAKIIGPCKIGNSMSPALPPSLYTRAVAPTIRPRLQC